MGDLAGVELLDVVSESARSVVQRGRRRQDSRPLILKRMRDPRMLPDHCARYRQEFEVARRFCSPVLVQALDLVSAPGGLTIVFEDVGARSLDRFAFGDLSIVDVLRIAIQVCGGLHTMHSAHVIHGDIKPSNIVWNRATGTAQIIDFGAAVFAVANEVPQVKVRALEGTVAYMAPEQTGRMNRAIDHRSDLYALGATLYELVAGRTPFVASDPLELIHCHLARTPESPSDVDGRVPRMLSSLILKLLEKSPEDRYRSALGVRADLERCLYRIEASEDPSATPELGLVDAPQNLTLPQKLYGRATELSALRAALARAATGRPELMLVAGYSGIGKTSLIRELQLPTAGRRGHFIAGKFDLLQRNEPYSAFAEALRELVNQLLCLTDEALAAWKTRLLEAMGPNGGVLVEFLPEMALVIGEQVEPVKLGAVETKNRFLLTIEALFGVLCRRDQPLVIFLDDLQWADSASLSLLELLLAGAGREGLLVIGAYRDNEVTPAHPLAHFIDQMTGGGVNIERLHLGPLERQALSDLCSDVLFRSADDVRPIVDLLVAKTDGNPFFVGQFLRALAEEGVLGLDASGARWRCDVDALGARAVMENVGDLLGRRLHALPPETKRALYLASCIGNAFDLQTVAWVSDRGEAETYASLMPALAGGLIVSTSELGAVGTDAGARLVHGHYRFMHDRIQQAAYALEDGAERARSHLRIGRRLREQGGARAVEHLNAARALLTDPSERSDLARRNFVLGQQAKASAAFESARAFLLVATELAPGWDADHEFCFGLRLASGELASLVGDYPATEAVIPELLDRARTPLEKAEVYRLRIWQYTMQVRFDLVLETGRMALRVLGVDLPDTNVLPALGEAIGEVNRRLEGRSILSLFDLPEMTDERVSVAMRLLRGLQPAAYMADQELYALINARLVTLSLEYGNSPMSGAGYGTYGILVGPIQGQYQDGYDWGLLAWRLSERFASLQQRCSDGVHFGVVIPWVEHIRETFPVLDEGFRAGLESGELQWAGYILPIKAMGLLHSGVPLETVDAYVSEGLRWSNQCNHDLARACLRSIDLAVRSLTGIDADERTFSTRETSAASFFESIEDKHVPSAFAHTSMGLCLFVYGRFREALQHLRRGEPELRFIPGMLVVATHALVQALSAAALFDGAEPGEREGLRALVAEKLELIAGWARSSPANFEASRLLVEGELARIAGDRWRALQQADAAAARARAEGFVWIEAVAHERMARLLLASDCRGLAASSLQKARDAHLRWGAARKVKLLSAELRGLPGGTQMDAPRGAAGAWPGESTPLDGGETHRVLDEVLDLASAMKAAAAISQEVELHPLLGLLVHTCLESAGAENVALILKEEGGLVVAAHATVGASPRVEPIPLEAYEPVVSTIAQYVLRRGEPVVIDDALQDATFGADEEVQRRKPRSIIAVPLRRGGTVMGALYLENNRMAAAFHPARVRVLDLLAVQAAISLENARFFEKLQCEVAERRRVEATVRFLADTGAELAESLDYAATLAKVAHLAVPVLADWCVIDVIEGDRRIRRVASAHTDPTKAPILAALRERYTPTWDSPHPAACVLRSGKPVLRADVTESALEGFGVDAEHVRLVRELGTKTMISVPLIARDQTLGVMSFASAVPGRRYGSADLTLATELARRAALSIDNSRLYRDAQQAVRERDEFLSVASHELRTPITSMVLALHAFEPSTPPPTPEMVKKALSIVSRQTKRLRALVEDLLSVSRIELGRLGENLETVDLASLAREVTDRFAEDIVREGCRMSFKADKPVLGRWEKDRLDQVITNLLSNARKFGAGKPIEVVVDEAPGVARLSVQDHGIGMAPEALEHIFDRFGRAVSTRHYGGLGLGLYIVHEIARAHGGTVRVESALGQGSLFTVELPLSAEHSAAHNREGAAAP